MTATSSARTWPILLEMQQDGKYPEVPWQYAVALARKPLPKGGLGDGYVDALGRPTG